MFSETYTRVKLNAEVEFYFQICSSLFLHLNVYSPLPPPFNLPSLIYKLSKRDFPFGDPSAARNKGSGRISTHSFAGLERVSAHPASPYRVTSSAGPFGDPCMSEWHGSKTEPQQRYF